LTEELDKLRQQKSEERFNVQKLSTAGKILDALMTGEKFQEFLTPVAYEYLT